MAVLLAIPAGIYLLSQLDDDAADAVAEDTRADDGDEAAPGDRPPDDDGDGDPADRDAAPDGDPGAGEDVDPDPDDGTDGADNGDSDAEVAPLDPDPLTGPDLLWGQLLLDIDASERAMIAFQEDLSQAFAAPGVPEDALTAASEVATERREQLLEVRERLAGTVDDDAADEVRARYVVHLDSWEAFMAAVEEDPLVVLEQRERGFTVDINATADAFARALEEELPTDVDAEVTRFADDILDRGFRGFGTAQV